jgi:hypothetical protein
MFIDENTSRVELEQVAVQDCGIGLDIVAELSDAMLLEAVQNWIEAGDECADAA